MKTMEKFSRILYGTSLAMCLVSLLLVVNKVQDFREVNLANQERILKNQETITKNQMVIIKATSQPTTKPTGP